MNIIKWRESYKTGITSMDIQHHNLIDLINDLYKVIVKKSSIDSIQTVLYEMTKYAENHLEEEEALLKKTDYPNFSDHIAIHKNYRKMLKKLMNRVEKDKKSAVQDTYTFLRQWWIGHIVAEDQKYGKHLTQKGVE